MFIHKKRHRSGAYSIEVLREDRCSRNNLCFRKDNDCKKNASGKVVKPCDNDIKHDVKRISYAYTKKICGGGISVVFYDMTTLYFEAAQEDDLRKSSFSKDGKHSCPQIFLGLLVTTGGNPIGYGIYEGNIHEGKTLVPMIKDLAGRHGFDHPVVITDAGLLSLIAL